MDRTQKEALVATLNGVFSKSTLVVVAHYSGLNVAQMTDLRRRASAVGAQFRVTKNRLTKLALKGTVYDSLSDLFTGPTAIAYSDDPVAAAKVAVTFAKDNEKLVILGGALGERLLDQNGVRMLAETPSLDELRGRIVGLLQAPATKV
ncbi:MAG: 50S ribosomal protein L10, partial [Acetobacterales bacterium]